MRKYYVFALRAFADVLGTILVPAVAAFVIKTAFHLPTTIFLAILALTFGLTAIVLWKKISQYGRAFQQLNRTQDELRRSGS